MAERTYLCIDLKSFYASVECIERGLDPMATNLVVADLSRTEKTICLAVTPSLKSYGVKSGLFKDATSQSFCFIIQVYQMKCLSIFVFYPKLVVCIHIHVLEIL